MPSIKTPGFCEVDAAIVWKFGVFLRANVADADRGFCLTRKITRLKRKRRVKQGESARVRPTGDVTLFVQVTTGGGSEHLPPHLPISRSAPDYPATASTPPPQTRVAAFAPNLASCIPIQCNHFICQISPIADGVEPRTDADRCHGSIKGQAGLSRLSVVPHAQDEM